MVNVPEDVGAVGALQIGVIMLVALLVIAISLAVSIAICLVLSGCFKRIPEAHRKMEPSLVWLLLIPCFNLVWNFFVWLRLADSYKSYFDSVGNTQVGDCGRLLNLAFCICCVCSLIPCLNYLAGPASLVLLIICLLKAYDLKTKIERGGHA